MAHGRHDTQARAEECRRHFSDHLLATVLGNGGEQQAVGFVARMPGERHAPSPTSWIGPTAGARGTLISQRSSLRLRILRRESFRRTAKCAETRKLIGPMGWSGVNVS